MCVFDVECTISPIYAGKYCECCVLTVRSSSERSVFGRVGRFNFQVKRTNVTPQGHLFPSTYIGEYSVYAPSVG